jgi:hypothetical protein
MFTANTTYPSAGPPLGAIERSDRRRRQNLGVVTKCLIGLPLLMHIELLWRGRSFKNRGVGVGAFVYRLHSPAVNTTEREGDVLTVSTAECKGDVLKIQVTLVLR